MCYPHKGSFYVKELLLKKDIVRALFLMFSMISFDVFAATTPEIKGNQEELGTLFIKGVVLSAQNDLMKKGVPSRVDPSKSVVTIVPASVIHRLIVVENTSKNDLTTGKLSWLYREIGKHGFKKLSQKRSKADARGILQITKGGFDYVFPLYKKAGLDAGFSKAAIDPITSAKVAILFVDSALAALTPKERLMVKRNDVLFHDYIATAYNGGLTHALKLLRTSGTFSTSHKQETREYIAKMRMARLDVHV